MIIRHSLPSKAYTKVDRNVFTDMRLSDGACRLYGFLCSLRNGANFTDAYILKAMQVSQTVLTRRKKALKDSDLILIDQVSPKLYVVYIGYTSMPATVVKKQWVNEDMDS